ncbi:hypothetical protein [Cellulomonas sp. P5_C5]
MSAPLPRFDPYLASVGEQVEDISRIAAAQPFRSRGPSLPRDDLDLLVRATRAKLRKFRATPALLDAGLMDDQGPTSDGRTVARLLQVPAGRLHLESGRGRAPLTLDVYVHGTRAIALSTVSPAALVDVLHGDDLLAAATTVGVDIVASSAVPAHIAAWVGLAPAWSLGTSPVEIAEATVMARVDDPSTPPPPDADAALRYVWEQPWFLLTMTTAPFQRGLFVVNAGPAGQFVVNATTKRGVYVFQAFHSSVVWLTLVDTVALASDV